MRGLPGGGAMLGMFGGFGGKKKVVAAGIRLISPASGQTVAQGAGEVKKTSISFGGAGGTIGAVANGATGAAYAGSKDGQMLIEAFIKAFNSVSAQGACTRFDGSGGRSCNACGIGCGRYRHRHQDARCGRYQVCNAPHRARRNRSHPHWSAHGTFDRGQ